jgi:hypothetical protein
MELGSAAATKLMGTLQPDIDLPRVDQNTVLHGKPLDAYKSDL